MKTYLFKTNINCSGCIKSITPFLNKAEGIENWKVDITSSDKTLIVETLTLSPDEVCAIVQRAGFKAELK